MFEPNNRIIIVDDIEKELLDLAKVFLSNGKSCRTILYDGSYDTPLSGVRIAFFDIKLSGKSFDVNQEEYNYKTDRNLSSVFNDLSIAIECCIHADNGPFALIFWSKTTGVIDNFKEYIRERNPGLPSPVFVDAIDKNEFIGKTPKEFNDRLEKIFEDSSIKLLLDFENKCELAATHTIDELYKIIPDNNESKIWADSKGFEENFDLIFSSIAKSSLGSEYSQINTDLAISEAIMPIVNYRMSESSINESKWKTKLKAITKKKIDLPNNFKPGLINSIFHIDTITEINYEKRGAVYEYNFELPFFKKILFSLVPYFEDMEKHSKTHFGKFLSFNEKASTEVKDNIRGKSCFIAIELSASCDFSQNKGRNHKFLIGLKTPKFSKEIIDIENMSNSIFYNDIPEFCIEDEEFFIFVNFNYIVSDFKKNNNFGKPLFILKKELIDMLGNRYANHVSRIGITSF